MFTVEKSREKLKAKVRHKCQFCSTFPPVGPLESLHETGPKLHFCASFFKYFPVLIFQLFRTFAPVSLTVNTLNANVMALLFSK
jgi:hypothetical protein